MPSSVADCILVLLSLFCCLHTPIAAQLGWLKCMSGVNNVPMLLLVIGCRFK